MSRKPEHQRFETGVRNMDPLLGGGLPKDSVTIISGPTPTVAVVISCSARSASRR